MNFILGSPVFRHVVKENADALFCGDYLGLEPAAYHGREIFESHIDAILCRSKVLTLGNGADQLREDLPHIAADQFLGPAPEHFRRTWIQVYVIPVPVELE